MVKNHINENVLSNLVEDYAYGNPAMYLGSLSQPHRWVSFHKVSETEYIPPVKPRTKKCDGCYQKEYTQNKETGLSNCDYCGLSYEGNE